MAQAVASQYHGPGKRAPGDDLAPVFRVEVEGQVLRDDITQFISSLEYESAVGMADMLRLVIDNPGVVDNSYIDFNDILWPNWADHKAFQPGNEVNLYVGYVTADRPENFVGRVQWVKHLPNFPREGIAQLEVKGYDASHMMMDATGPITKTARTATLKVTRPVEAKDNQGQVLSNIRHSEVVEYIARMHNMSTDIDHTSRQENVVIKKGMKHFELVKGLANLNNREFWVDYDIKMRKWVLHWKGIQRAEQKAGYIFRYNSEDKGTLLEANPEFGLRETVNEAVISVFDQKNQQWVSAIEIEDAASEDPRFVLGGGLKSRSTASSNSKASVKKKRSKSEAKRSSERRRTKNVIRDAIDNAGAFRIAAAGFALDVLPPPGRRFKNAQEAGEWLLRWFKAKQENFITVTGTVIGVETLRARQTHELRGLSTGLDGFYYFTRVRHVLNEAGYFCEFTANRVVTG